MWTRPLCPDCGPDTVSHVGHKTSIFLGWLFAPLTQPLAIVWQIVGPLVIRLPWEYVALFGFRILTFFRLATLTTEPDSKDNLRTVALWESAKKRGIHLREFRLFHRAETNTFVARYRGRIRVFDGLPRPERVHVPSVDWMDNKGIMKTRFHAAGIPVARGNTCFTFSSARNTFSQIRKPVIIKPHLGSRSRHTTIHINTETELNIAFTKAKQLSPWVIVEEELKGDVYRGTLIGGKVAGIIRRELPHVIADGVSDIRTLVKKENENPKRHGPVFHELPMDTDAKFELSRQGYTWESIPRKGAKITVSQKVSRSFGASTTDVTDIAHPENIVLLEKIGALLKDSLVGVDFIIDNVTKSWNTQDRAGIIECNSLPFIDLHHYPLVGTPRDAAGALWELVFPKNPNSQTSNYR